MGINGDNICGFIYVLLVYTLYTKRKFYLLIIYNCKKTDEPKIHLFFTVVIIYLFHSLVHYLLL
jgi:hypothetical protein